MSQVVTSAIGPLQGVTRLRISGRQRPLATLSLLMRVSSSFAIAPSLLMATIASSALAAPKKHEITSVDSIRRFMEKGQALFVAGQYVKSAEVFEAGFELHPYSAFLFNAGVAYEKADRLEDALSRFKKYVEVDADAPDVAEVKKRIARLEQDSADRREAEKSGKKAKAQAVSDEESATKSLVIVETEPTGALVHFYRQISGDAPFESASNSPGYQLVTSVPAPASVSLDVGKYHIVVDRVGNFNESGSDLEVVSGHVHQLKLNLSQGAFMAYLRVSASPKQARVFLDDPRQQKAPWGQVPHGELVPVGQHVVVVAAPGYASVTRSLSLTEGQKENISVDLQRVDFGTLRFESNAPEVNVVVDGRAIGRWISGSPPLLVEHLPAGSHSVSVTSPGRKPVYGTVIVPRGQVQPVHADMVLRPPRGAAWTQAIIGGVLLGGGIYFGLESNRLYDDLKADRGSGILVGDDSRATRGKIYSIGADVAFLGSAALAGLATYNFLRDPLPPSRLEMGLLREFEEPMKTESPRGAP